MKVHFVGIGGIGLSAIARFLNAKEILGTEIPDSTFYIWLNVKNGVRFAAELYKEENLLVLPGEFLARDFATEYVRIALVESPDRTREGLLRLKNFMDKGVI